MSKKRGRAKHKPVKATDQVSGIPSEEILAEGSGPASALEMSDGEMTRAGTSLEDTTEHVAETATDAGDGADLQLSPELDAEPLGASPELEAAEPLGASPELDAEPLGASPELEAEPLDASSELEAEPLDASSELDGEQLDASPELEAAEALQGEVSDTPPLDAQALDAAADELDDELAGDPGEPGMDLEASEDGDDETDLEAEGGAVLPTSAASMDATQLKQLVEALVFASDKPLTIQRLRQLTRVSDVSRLEQTLAELAADYQDRGLVLQQVSGGYQFRTRSQFSVWVQQLIAGRPVRLSRAQLETLAIVAYRQPITRPEIDDIRGVDSSATLKLLMDRLLIRVLGKKEEAGRPMLYGTTKEFLDFFSLGDLRELPTLREYSELSDESRQVINHRLGVAPEEGGGDGSGSGGGFDGSGGGGDDGGGEPGGGSEPGGSEPGGSMPGDDETGEVGEPLGASARTLSDLATQVLANDASDDGELDDDAAVRAAVAAGSTDGEVLEAGAEVIDSSDEAIDAEADAIEADAVEADAGSVDAEVLEAGAEAAGTDGESIEADANEPDGESLEADAGAESIDAELLASDAESDGTEDLEAGGEPSEVFADGSAPHDAGPQAAEIDFTQAAEDSMSLAGDEPDHESSRTPAVDPMIAAEVLAQDAPPESASGEPTE